MHACRHVGDVLTEVLSVVAPLDLLYKYADAIDGVDYHQLVNASQGDNSAEIGRQLCWWW
jgi:hypothetical protein